jgi:hypothetical protein
MTPTIAFNPLPHSHELWESVRAPVWKSCVRRTGFEENLL